MYSFKQFLEKIKRSGFLSCLQQQKSREACIFPSDVQSLLPSNFQPSNSLNLSLVDLFSSYNIALLCLLFPLSLFLSVSSPRNPWWIVQPRASMEQGYKRLPPDVLYKMRLLRLDTDEEGTMKFASFSSQVEKEVEDKYICKLLPHTLALAALFSALRNAQSIPKHDLIIERSPNQCYLLKFIKDTDRNRSIFRQNFLVYSSLFAVVPWDNHVDFYSFTLSNCCC